MIGAYKWYAPDNAKIRYYMYISISIIYMYA